MMHRKDIKPNHLWFVRQSPDKLSEDSYIHTEDLQFKSARLDWQY